MSDDLEAVVFDDAGERITSEHPEWAAVCEYRKQQTIRQDPASVQRRLMLDLRRDIRTTFDAVMGEVDDLDHRERAEEVLADVLSGQVDPRFEHIATWWDQFLAANVSPHRAWLAGSNQLSGQDQILARRLAQEWERHDGEERTESGLTIVRHTVAAPIPRARRSRSFNLDQAVRAARQILGKSPPQYPAIELIAEEISREEEAYLSASGLTARWQRHKNYGEKSITFGEIMALALSS